MSPRHTEHKPTRSWGIWGHSICEHQVLVSIVLPLKAQVTIVLWRMESGILQAKSVGRSLLASVPIRKPITSAPQTSLCEACSGVRSSYYSRGPKFSSQPLGHMAHHLQLQHQGHLIPQTSEGICSHIKKPYKHVYLHTIKNKNKS